MQVQLTKLATQLQSYQYNLTQFNRNLFTSFTVGAYQVTGTNETNLKTFSHPVWQRAQAKWEAMLGNRK